MKQEDDLGKKIAEAIKGEVERLPSDGGDVDLRIKVKGDLVNGNKTVIVNPVRRPPPGNPNRRQCPQCGETTWSATEHCIDCGCNLFAYDAQRRAERLSQRRLKIVVTLAAIAIAGMFLGQYAPVPIRFWIYGIAGFCGLLVLNLGEK